MALTFNGSSSNYALKALTFSADTGTVMGWVRIATDRNDYSTFFQTNNVDNSQFVLQTTADGTTLSLYTYNGSVTGTNLTAGTWYHLALTWDGTTARAYLNGVLDISNSNTGSDWNEVRLGVSYWGEPLNGNIAFVKAWNATLTQQEIEAERRKVAAVRTSNLLGQWETPDGATRVNDFSGNANHLTATGTLTDYNNPWSAIGSPSYINAVSNGNTSAGTTATVNVPSGTADKDVLIAAVAVEVATATITPDQAGWTQLWNTTVGGGRSHTQAVFARKATGSEPASYTWTISSGEWCGAIVTYRNAALPSIYNSQANNSSVTSCTAPTLSTPSAHSWSVWVGSSMYGTTWTPPGSYSERADYRTSTTLNNLSVSVADRLVASASATGTVVGTAANADYNVGGHVVLAPYIGPDGTANVTLGAVTLSAAGTVAAPGTSGSASITLAALTTTAAGTVTVAGTATNTLAALTTTAAGTVAVAGAATATLGATTVNAAGTVAIAGTATNTLGALTTTAAGTVAVVGTATNTLATITLDAAGTVATVTGSGTADITFAAATLSATGAVAVAGAGNVTLGAVGITAAGTVAVTGSANVTSAALTTTAAGTVAVTGAADITLASVGASAAGVVAVTGAADVTLAALTTTAAGTVAVTGSATLTLAALAVKAAGNVGNVPIEGTAVIILGAMTAQGTGTVAVGGTAAITLAALGGTATGTVAVTGTAAVTLGAVALDAAGAVAVMGSATSTFAAVTVDAAGAVAVAGSADATLAPVTVSGAGVVPIVGSAANTLAPVAVDGTGTVAVTGTAAVTLGALTMTAEAMTETAQAIHGEAAIALGALSLSAAGIVAFVTIVNRVSGPGTRGGTVVGAGSRGTVVGAAGSGNVTGSSGTGTVHGPKAQE